MPVKGSIPIRDASGEVSSINVNLANDVTNVTGITALDAITTAINTDSMILGLSNGSRVSFAGNVTAGPVPPGAEREFKWLIGITDTQQFLDPGTDTVPNPGFGKNYTFTVPTADSSIKPVGSDNLPLADVPAFVAAVNANVVSPTGGSVTVTYIRIVGRNI